MNADMLRSRLTECGIPFHPQAPEQLLVYHELLMDWNTRMDLTAVLAEDELLDRHYMDSLMPLALGLIPEKGRLIDVGTGAGFPGMPLAILLPELQVTLLDAQQKRLTFLQAVVDALKLTNVTLIHARAEDGARDKAHRERYDLAVARAVAPLPVLAEYLLPYVAPGGRALCWKGPSVLEELTAGRRACHLLGGSCGEPVPCPIPGRDWQHLLIPMEKTQPCAKAYPRKAGTPAKSPLG